MHTLAIDPFLSGYIFYVFIVLSEQLDYLQIYTKTTILISLLVDV
jgi:hypothetical protein